MAQAETSPTEERLRRAWIWLLAIVALGAALRLYGLGQLSFWYDEAAELHLAQYTAEPANLLDLDYLSDPPLYPLLVRHWYSVVKSLPGVEPGSLRCDTLLRLMPCAFGVLGIVLTFLVGRAVLKRDAPALMGAFLFAISPFQIQYAQDLRSYSLHVVLALLAMWLVVGALEQNRVWQWAALAVVMTLGIYNSTFTVWIVMALSVYFVATFRRHWRLVGHWTAWNAAVVVLCIPTLRHAARVSAVFESGTQRWFPYPTVRIGLITFKDFFAGYSPNAHVYWLLFIAAGVLVVIGLASLIRRPSALLLLFLLAFFPIVVNLVYANMRSFPYYTHRLMIASAAPCYLLAAAGAYQLRRRALMAGALAAVGVLSVPCLVDYYAQRMHPSWDHVISAIYKVDNRAAAAHIAERLEEGDFVAHRSHHTLMPFYYYLDEAEQAMVRFCAKDRYEVGLAFPHKPILEHWGLVAEGLEAAASRARRIWFVESSWQPFQFDPVSWWLRGWLDAHGVCLERVPFDGLTLHLYRIDTELKLTTRTNRVVHHGYDVADYDVFPDTPAGRCAADASSGLLRQSLSQATRETPTACYLRFELAAPDAEADDTEVDWSLLTAGQAGEPVAAASFPQRATGPFAYRFVLANTSDTPRTFHGWVFESADVIEPMSFHRSNPTSDHWIPAAQQDPGPPRGYFNTFSMVAIVNADMPADEVIHRQVRLPEGDYTVFARVSGEADPVAQWAADGVLTATSLDGTERPIGILRGNDPDGEAGWTWREAGACHSDGRPFRFTIRAAKRDEVDEAYLLIERILFVPAAWGREADTLLAEEFEVTLGPGEEKRFTFSSDLGGQPKKRVDIKVFDPLSKEFRLLWFYVEQGG